ncbi:flagellar basal body rod protein FlgB [Roseibium porphyridii]|uniref:Flagellar basal body rod protein FlgB n=1 Tax=Roseibium porphyridii TaxID=2866279 RepID=A0ABY8F8Q2_9HYPH|nr:flagellar basal body rod protein FlgB [Roseibium sp. KMA01]WFE91883.1 flagellar basal body rod protein FlgB [Roseibium sp. KMA01]
MTMTDLPLFQAIKSKMRWHQTRQGVLAENIANADTPGFGASDVKAFSFSDHIGRETFGLATSTTKAGHISTSISGVGSAKIVKDDGFEVTPSGNNVNLEEQMMKLTENQMDYQAATTLYTKSLGLIRTALSKSV